jgi:cephalosporin-C deacetylase
MQFDLPIADLEGFRYAEPEPADLDDFWAQTLAEERGRALDVRRASVPTRLATVEVTDLEFTGYGGDRVKAWLIAPAGGGAPRPAIVEFVGYGGGRGLAHESLLWASAGYAHLLMDTRGQGGTWRGGDTADPHGTTASAPGFLTRSIGAPRDYYYRRVFVDAVRAVDAARTLDEVDPARVAVTGISQGGGVAIAAAALAGDVAALAARVPFLCAFRRASVVTDCDPYAEIGRFLANQRTRSEELFSTLGYFDGVFLARRASCPGWFSVGLMDDVCPPSTVYAAFNEYAGPKHLQVWPYNDHDGGGAYDDALLLDWFAERLSA